MTPQTPAGEPSTYPVKSRRRYPSAPLVGVGVAVLDDAGRVLLVRRGNPPHAGEWGLPGGLVDLGERLVDAARREVREECAIEVDVGGVVGTYEPIERDGDGQIEYHYVVIDFWARLRAGTAQAQDDAAAVAWVAMDELDGYMLSADARGVIANAFQAWSAA